MAAPSDAMDALVARYGLVPHPEGGFFAEVVRSGSVTRADGATRAALTVIHYVLPAGHISRWHRVVGADEVWTHVGGDALSLYVLDGETEATHRLGEGGALLATVPAGAWQAACPEAGPTGYAHVTCTVAPGFDPADWQLAVDAADAPWERLASAAGNLR